MKILFEDTRIIAVSKDPGELAVFGRNSPSEPLSQVLSRRLGQAVHPVHRLDKDTSGVLIFAKDTETHRTLCELFESHKVKKTYWALVRGKMEGEGNINLRLHVFGSGRVGISGDGKPALTHYQVLKSSEDASWLQLSPMTGRKHQIRAHLYAIGHPVLGDTLYGDKKVAGIPRLMLHALEISFPGQKWPVFRAEPPADFLNFANTLFAPGTPS